MQISTQQPIYFIVFCLAAAAVFTWLLYRTNPFTDEQSGKRPWWVWLITSFRFLVLFVLCFLLLEPLLKAIQRHIEKPVVIIAVDASESVLANKDSAFYRTQLAPQLQQLGNTLGSDYEVSYFQFGKETKTGLPDAYTEKQTDLSALFDDLFNRYDKQNIGAVLLATDGIYNEGASPLPNALNLHAPVICVALGDTNLQRDAKVSNVRHNQLAYFGNTFPILIEAEASNCPNENVRITVTKNGKSLFEKNLSITKNRQFFSEQVTLQADERGMQHYVVNVSRVNNEISYVNNSFDVFIDVLDGRQKILLLAQSPHPDLGAILNAIESNKNYEAKLQFIEDVPNPVADAYSLVILHQLPGGSIGIQQLLEQLSAKHIPTLFVAGAQTNINALNLSGCGYSINGYRGLTTDAEPDAEPTFGLFTLDETLLKAINAFPPLKAPFGNYVTKGENEILLKQRISHVATPMPLISFNKSSETHTGVIFGEGLWKWRLADFQQHGNQDAFNELWSKLVQYLAVKDDKRTFRVRSDKKHFSENEHVTFEAELYNKSYELINEAEVQMQLSNSKGKNYTYSFSKINQGYSLDAGILPPGSYRYEAATTLNGKRETASGSFIVKPLVAELINTRADHQLLAALAAETKGQVFYPNNISAIPAFIKNNETIKPVVYRQEEIMDLITMKWVFGLLLFFLSTEWFIRKRNGAY